MWDRTEVLRAFGCEMQYLYYAQAVMKATTMTEARIKIAKADIIYLLNGKNTGNLGVVEMDGPEGGRIKATDVERTLIDATVRLVYAGGPLRF